MSAPSVRVAVEGAIATLTMVEPARRNVLAPKMIDELREAFEGVRANDAVRVVVLAAEGTMFCGGGDLSVMKDRGEGASLRSGFGELLTTMVRFEKPIVARVQGHAMGGGLGLVAASTFAIAAEGVELGTPEIEVGLFPMMIMAILVRCVPRRRLLSMMLLGERLPAHEAVQLGLLNSVTPAYALDGGVGELALRLASKSPIAMRLGLKAFADQEDLGWPESLTMLEARLMEVASSEDAREGITAFIEKRAPVWPSR